MASNTPNLGLLKKDPMTDGNETFNIETMLNENWDKIDTAVGQVREGLENVNVDIPDASLTEKGIVQLSSATNGTRENVAATEKAVKAAYDRGSAAEANAKVYTDQKIAAIPPVSDASLTQKGIVQLSNAINGTRQNIAATEYAVNLAVENVKANNYDGRKEDVIYHVPSAYPTIQAALNAIKIHNAGRRIIRVAPGYTENGNIDFQDFMSGVISIEGDYNSPASINGGININDAICNIGLRYLNLTSSSSLLNCQSPCTIHLLNVTKTVASSYDAFWFGGQCKAVLNFCTISNQSGNAIYAMTNASVYCSSIKGSGNGTAFNASSAIIFDSSISNSIGAATRVRQSDGGRVFT